jgi:hypothetical protein
MKINNCQLIFAFVFSKRRFFVLSKIINQEINSRKNSGSVSNKDTLSKVRTNIVISFTVVIVATIIGSIVGYFGNLLFGPVSFSINKLFQYFGVGILLWGTLGKQGLDIETFCGETAIERVDRFIYRTFYIIGSFFLVLSASWPYVTP